MFFLCRKWKKKVLYTESFINRTKFYGSGNSLNFL